MAHASTSLAVIAVMLMGAGCSCADSDNTAKRADSPPVARTLPLKVNGKGVAALTLAPGRRDLRESPPDGAPPPRDWKVLRATAEGPPRTLSLPLSTTYSAHTIELVSGHNGVDIEVRRPIPADAPPHVRRAQTNPQHRLPNITGLELWTREPPSTENETHETPVPVYIDGRRAEPITRQLLERLPRAETRRDRARATPHTVVLRDLLGAMTSAPYTRVVLSATAGDWELSQEDVVDDAVSTLCKFNRQDDLVCRRAPAGATAAVETLRGIREIRLSRE